MENKRKINRCTSLNGTYIHKKMKEQYIQNNESNIDEDLPKKEPIFSNPVGAFQLVVVKLPWYKKLFRSFMGFFGFGYY